jgi:hypothetical protein
VVIGNSERGIAVLANEEGRCAVDLGKVIRELVVSPEDDSVPQRQVLTPEASPTGAPGVMPPQQEAVLV